MAWLERAECQQNHPDRLGGLAYPFAAQSSHSFRLARDAWAGAHHWKYQRSPKTGWGGSSDQLWCYPTFSGLVGG